MFMKYILPFFLLFSLSFAGHFEKSSDTTNAVWNVQYEYDVKEVKYVEPTPTVVIYRRTAPSHCINKNCKENNHYNHKFKHSHKNHKNKK